MPGGDRTGPGGMGPMSGRAAGYCKGTGMPRYAAPFGRRGFGMGFGGGCGTGRRHSGEPGYGRRRMFMGTNRPGGYGCDEPVPHSDSHAQMQALKRQAEILQSEQDYVNRRIAEIESGDAKE